MRATVRTQILGLAAVVVALAGMISAATWAEDPRDVVVAAEGSDVAAGSIVLPVDQAPTTDLTESSTTSPTTAGQVAAPDLVAAGAAPVPVSTVPSAPSALDPLDTDGPTPLPVPPTTPTDPMARLPEPEVPGARIDRSGLWHVPVVGTPTLLHTPIPLFRLSDSGMVFVEDGDFVHVGNDGSVQRIVVPPCPPPVDGSGDAGDPCDPSRGPRQIQGWDASGSWLVFSWTLPSRAGEGVSRTPLSVWDEEVIERGTHRFRLAIAPDGAVASILHGGMFLPDERGWPTRPVPDWNFDWYHGIRWSADGDRLVLDGVGSIATINRDGDIGVIRRPRSPSPDTAVANGVIITAASLGDPGPRPGPEAALVNASSGERYGAIPPGHIRHFDVAPAGDLVAMSLQLPSNKSRVLVLRTDGSILSEVDVDERQVVYGVKWHPSGSGAIVVVEDVPDHGLSPSEWFAEVSCTHLGVGCR